MRQQLVAQAAHDVRLRHRQARPAALGLERPLDRLGPGRRQQLVHARGVLGVVEGDDLRRARQQAAVVAGHPQPGERPLHLRANRIDADVVDQHVEHVADLDAAVVGLAGDPLDALAVRRARCGPCDWRSAAGRSTRHRPSSPAGPSAWAFCRFTTGRATASEALLAWAGVEPQQTQSGISSSSMPSARQTARVDWSKSHAVDSRLQPGKKAYFTASSPPLPPGGRPRAPRSRRRCALGSSESLPLGQHLGDLVDVGEEVAAAELVGGHHAQLEDAAVPANAAQERAVELLAAGVRDGRPCARRPSSAACPSRRRCRCPSGSAWCRPRTRHTARSPAIRAPPSSAPRWIRRMTWLDEQVHLRADRAAGRALVALEARADRRAAAPFDLAQKRRASPLQSHQPSLFSHSFQLGLGLGVLAGHDLAVDLSRVSQDAVDGEQIALDLDAEQPLVLLRGRAG